MTPLEAVTAEVDRVQREFVRAKSGFWDKGGTAYMIGAAADKAPEQFAGLKDAQTTLLKALADWKKLAKTGASTPEQLVVSGKKLVRAFDDLNATAKSATPSSLAGAVKGTLGVVGDVGADLAKYAEKINPEKIFGQAAWVLNNAVPIAIGVGLLWLLGPRIAQAIATRKRPHAGA
jgi:hypothetical protein